MDRFIKEYLHSKMDNSLLGKRGFFADTIDDMKAIVNHNKIGVYEKLVECFDNCDKPFKPFFPLGHNKSFKLFYYDPYIDLKAGIDYFGKTLEVNLDGVWTEVTDLESFFTKYPNPYPPEQYMTELNRRIVTHRELTKWLATGHGQVRSSLGDNPKMYVVSLGYSEELDDKPVEDILVRTWDDVAWHLPTASYLGLDK